MYGRSILNVLQELLYIPETHAMRNTVIMMQKRSESILSGKRISRQEHSSNILPLDQALVSCMVQRLDLGPIAHC